MVIERIVNSVFASNTYLLHEDGYSDYWIVDIGDIPPVLALLPAGAVVRGLFITHTHFDHFYGINDLTSRFPECAVFTSDRGREGLYSDRLNFSRYHGNSLVYQGGNVRVLHEDDRIMLWPGYEVEVFETPGHDWSCLTYRIENAVFSGDSYLPGIAVFAKFPKSDKDLSVKSKDKIISVSIGKGLYPGHGDFLLDQEKNYL